MHINIIHLFRAPIHLYIRLVIKHRKYAHEKGKGEFTLKTVFGL